MMAFASYAHINSWLELRSVLLFPLLCALVMAGSDVKSRRIPNYLTMTTALSGLAFRGVFYGISGLIEGVLGLLLGFGLLFLPYYLKGMGAGDVKALAALGAWLGPKFTFFLFIYMGLAGGIMALAFLWWQGLLWQKLRRAKVYVVNCILSRQFGASPQATPGQSSEVQGIPYGVAIAMGMLAVFWIGN
jgi:prepilin peptidase CpaA